MNELTEEEKMIKNMGALGYPPIKIATIMNKPLSNIQEWYFDKESKNYKLYKNI